MLGGWRVRGLPIRGVPLGYAYDPLLVEIVCIVIRVYLLILVARAITSFFPVTPGTTFAQIVDVLYRLTEPVLAPVRKVIPPLGMFDVSFLVLVIGIQVLSALIGCGGGIF